MPSRGAKAAKAIGVSAGHRFRIAISFCEDEFAEVREAAATSNRSISDEVRRLVSVALAVEFDRREARKRRSVQP